MQVLHESILFVSSNTGVSPGVGVGVPSGVGVTLSVGVSTWPVGVSSLTI